MRYLLSIAVLVLLASALSAATINVPADQPTIQAGIDAAVTGDTVLVAPGTYLENINFRGKGIVVSSHYCYSADTLDIASTIIDGSSPAHPDSGSVVFFGSGEDTTSVVNGFTITGGIGTAWVTPGEAHGGGVLCFGDVSPIISNNYIQNNDLGYILSMGAGIFASSGGPNFNPAMSPRIIQNRISYNRVRNGGAAIYIERGNALVDGNIFFGNSDTALLDWTGVVGVHKSNAIIIHNTFLSNSINYISDSPHGGIIETLFVQDNLFYQEPNPTSSVFAIHVNSYAPVYTALSHNCFYGDFSSYFSQLPLPGILDLSYANINGDTCDQHENLYLYPEFCDTSGSNYAVFENSVLVNAASDTSIIGAFGVGCYAPTILSTSPAQNELNVPVDANITVTFDSDMDPASINDSTIVVNGSLTGKHSGTITYDSLARTATIDSDTDFDQGESVTVVLTSGIESELGIPCENGYTWCFVTGTGVGWGVFTMDSIYSVGTWPHSICGGDLDSDGDNDLITGNKTSADISILLNNGDGSFDSRVDYPIGGGTRSVCLADLDADGDLDIACANNTTNDVSVLLNAGDGTFGAYSNYGVGNSPYAIVAMDLDADGAVDLAIANAGVPHSVSVLLNNGNGTFGAHSTYSAGDGPHGIAGSDFDSDGDIDLVIANAGSNDISVLMNDGTGVFELAGTYSVGTVPWSVHAKDFDGDGSPDLAIANRDSDDISVLFNNGSGEFGEGLTYPAGNAPVSISVADLDGDGDLDIIVAAEGPGDIAVLVNLGDGTFATDSTYWAGDRCYSVFACDLDGDGDADIATANLDANTVSIFKNVPGAPLIQSMTVDDQVSAQHVVSHGPLFEWTYYDAGLLPQTQFEVAVGTDSDWEYAEMWNPAPFQVSDTFVTYAGIELLDGDTYYLRLRVNNGVAWSEWYETTFRMNSLPSVPMQLSPVDDVQTENQPWLWVQNSIDTESDVLTYDFFCSIDTTYGEPNPVEVFALAEQPDSTGWQVSDPLEENKRYWWMVRSHDGYEHSDWTDLFSSAFFVNASPEPPTAPLALYPPDTGNMPVFIMLPTFSWSESVDPDPLDTVRYKLEIALDSDFTFVQTVDSLAINAHPVADSLTFGAHYWWRVSAFDNTGLSTMSSNTPDFWTWTLGDIDNSHTLDISDLVMLVDWMFNGGPAPHPPFVADINGSCGVDISDLVYLVDYMFSGGPAPLVGCE